MGLGIDTLNCLGIGVNQSPLNTVAAFFVLMNDVTENDLRLFIERSKKDKSDIKRIATIIKNEG